MSSDPNRRVTLFACCGLLALVAVSPAVAQIFPQNFSQFWVGPKVGDRFGAHNPTNEEYFGMFLFYNSAGGLQDCAGAPMPAHGGHFQDPDLSKQAHDLSWEFLAVPTDSRNWDRSGNQGLGVVAWSKLSSPGTAMPPALLRPPATLVGRLNARSCICEQVQCHDQDDNVFGKLGVNCGSAPALDCNDLKWLQGECPVC